MESPKSATKGAGHRTNRSAQSSSQSAPTIWMKTSPTPPPLPTHQLHLPAHPAHQPPRLGNLPISQTQTRALQCPPIRPPHRAHPRVHQVTLIGSESLLSFVIHFPILTIGYYHRSFPLIQDFNQYHIGQTVRMSPNQHRAAQSLQPAILLRCFINQCSCSHPPEQF